MSPMWIVAIVLAGAFGLIIVCGGILAGFTLPAIQAAREAARRAQCANNLKMIGLALAQYESQYGRFPPAYIADADGKPMHSWRVLILPYLDEESLYSEYDFSEPWDGPKNRLLLTRMPGVYSCPSHAVARGDTNTAYAGVFGEHCAFRGPAGVRSVEITDGPGATLMVGEASRANIPWMKPQDIDIKTYPDLGNGNGFSSDHPGVVNFLKCDGAVHFISKTTNQTTLDALYTRDGGETVGNY